MLFSHINVDAALERLDGSMKLYRIILDNFEDKYGAVDVEIGELSKLKQFSEAQRLSHSIKGLSMNLGADKLAEYALALENIYKYNIILDEDIYLSRFGRELKEVIKEISEFLKELDGGNNKFQVKETDI